MIELTENSSNASQAHFRAYSWRRMEKWYVEILQDYHTYKKDLAKDPKRNLFIQDIFPHWPQFYVLAHILHNLGSVVMDISLFHCRPYFSLCYFCLLSVGSYEL